MRWSAPATRSPTRPAPSRRSGLAPLLVPGSAQNFKVTYAEDFALAEAVLQSRRVAKP